MNQKEVFEIIRNLRTKHGISLGEIENIQRKEIDILSTIEKIFDMSSQKEVDLLVALIFLLNDKPDNVFEWFKTTHSDCKYLSKAIDKNTYSDEYKLLIAAFVQNPLFFSMAWNWNTFNKESLAFSAVDDFYIPMAASSADKGFLYKQIPDIGTMYMYYDEDYEELTLRIEVNEENLNKKFKVYQKIQYAENGEIFEIEFENNGEKIIAGKPILTQNPSHGIRYHGNPKIMFE